MCWIGKITDFRIAFKDIQVIKFMTKNKVADNQFISEFYGKVYTLGKEERMSPFDLGYGRLPICKKLLVIDEGFHSYIPHPERYKSSANCIVNCIIPKGTIYFKNKITGHIVSNKIKVVWSQQYPVKKSF